MAKKKTYEQLAAALKASQEEAGKLRTENGERGQRIKVLESALKDARAGNP